MAENILPPAQVPGLPAEEAIEWGVSVASPVLLALANAAIHMVAARGRKWVHRTYTPYNDPRLSINSIPDLQETHTISLEPSPHAERYAVRVSYQCDPANKLAGGAFIRATLMTKIDGTGTDLDEVEWNVDEGTMPAESGAVRYLPSSRVAVIYPTLQVQTAYPSQPGAGADVSRPLEIGVGVPSPDFTIKVVSSDYVRVLAIDIWEQFEEVIEQ